MDLFATKVINLNERDFEIKYYRNTGFSGLTTYSSEIDLDINDRIILDSYNIYSLDHKLKLVLPAAIHTRIILNGEEGCEGRKK